MKTVNLTIAGTCTGDSGRGGWAFVLRMGEHSIERTGGSPLTTKAQMELSAVTEGLKALLERVKSISSATIGICSMASNTGARCGGAPCSPE
jgi:ribonuclease HI